MKNAKSITLNEIPDSGRHYHYDRQTAELNETLKDLIQDAPYEFDFFLKPIGNAYEIAGTLKTSLPLTCSRCAWDFSLPINQSFREILMVDEERPRSSHSTHHHTTNPTATGPYCHFLKSEHFDVGDFLHEMIAIAEPIQPMGKGQCDDNCENYQEALKQGWVKKDEPKWVSNPFSVLENLKK